MENIKSDWGILEYKDGRWDIILPSEDGTFYPARQYEIVGMTISINGTICTITGTKTEFKFYDKEFYLDGWTEEQIKEAPFMKNEIKYKNKTIRRWFKKSEIKRVAYLDNYIRLKKRTPIRITTQSWVLYDKRTPPVIKPEEVPAIMDSTNMD